MGIKQGLSFGSVFGRNRNKSAEKCAIRELVHALFAAFISVDFVFMEPKTEHFASSFPANIRLVLLNAPTAKSKHWCVHLFRLCKNHYFDSSTKNRIDFNRFVFDNKKTKKKLFRCEMVSLVSDCVQIRWNSM